MKILFLLFLLCDISFAGGWQVTIKLSAYPAEVINVGAGIIGTSYENSELDVWVSSDENESPEFAISVVPIDLEPNIVTKTINVDVTFISSILLGPIQTKTFMVMINENTILDTYSSLFDINFGRSTDNYSSLGQRWLVSDRKLY